MTIYIAGKFLPRRDAFPSRRFATRREAGARRSSGKLVSRARVTLSGHAHTYVHSWRSRRAHYHADDVFPDRRASDEKKKKKISSPIALQFAFRERSSFQPRHRCHALSLRSFRYIRGYKIANAFRRSRYDARNVRLFRGLYISSSPLPLNNETGERKRGESLSNFLSR